MANKTEVGYAGTESRGLRLKTGLWAEMDRLAKEDRRKTSQYVSIILENHIEEKQKSKGGKK